MSDFTGPGVYIVIPATAPSMSLNLWGGGQSPPGTQVKIYPKDPASNNTIWEFAAAGSANGSPDLGDREYHILSASSGLYVCCPTSGTATVTGEMKSCLDSSVRYKLRAAGNGAYFIISLNGNQLSVKDSGTAIGTDVVGATNMGSNNQFYLKAVPQS